MSTMWQMYVWQVDSHPGKVNFGLLVQMATSAQESLYK